MHQHYLFVKLYFQSHWENNLSAINCKSNVSGKKWCFTIFFFFPLRENFAAWSRVHFGSLLATSFIFCLNLCVFVFSLYVSAFLTLSLFPYFYVSVLPAPFLRYWLVIMFLFLFPCLSVCLFPICFCFVFVLLIRHLLCLFLSTMSSLKIDLHLLICFFVCLLAFYVSFLFFCLLVLLI